MPTPKEARIAPRAAANSYMTLDDAQVQFFHDNGYLRIDALTNQQEVNSIRGILQQLFEKRAGEKEGAFADLVAGADHPNVLSSPQILNPVNYVPKLHETQCFRNALSVAKQLLGDDARCFFDLSIMKKPKGGAATPWHQDEAFRDPNFKYNELTIWVALQPVKPEGGCLQFIPGSHKGPILDHHSANNDPTSQALDCSDRVDSTTAVACALEPGGCTIHHPRTLHGTAVNTSLTPRFAYIMTFGTSPTPLAEKRVFPWLVEKETPIQEQKKRWMRRGGVFVTVWRRLRRGDLTNWRAVVYGAKRSMKILRKGM
jgi:ectoine hydroxylase-related dioxygenase (phytanoyl-CoA dioxygenase family)